MPEPIALVHPAPNTDLATDLRALADEAERGEFIAATVITVRAGGAFRTLRFGKIADRELLGALCFAQADIIEANKPK